MHVHCMPFSYNIFLNSSPGQLDWFQNVSEYDQDMTQSQTADQPTTKRGSDTEYRHMSPRRQLKKNNQLSHPQRDDQKTRKNIKHCITKQRPNTNPHKQRVQQHIINIQHNRPEAAL